MSFLKEMNVNIDKDATVKVFKFPMEFDTVFCVVCGKERWIVFYADGFVRFGHGPGHLQDEEWADAH